MLIIVYEVSDRYHYKGKKMMNKNNKKNVLCDEQHTTGIFLSFGKLAGEKPVRLILGYLMVVSFVAVIMLTMSGYGKNASVNEYMWQDAMFDFLPTASLTATRNNIYVMPTGVRG